MKKRFAAMLAVFILIFMASCAGAPTYPAVDPEKPWGSATYAFEKSVYTVEIFSRKDGQDAEGEAIRIDGDILATGRFTQILTTANEGVQNLATVNSEFFVQWNDDERAGEHQGLYDEMSSTVVFATATCIPVSSEKHATLATRDGKNDSYSFTTDYNALTATVKTDKSSSGSDYTTEKTFPIKSGAFDNEQLFYLVRAFSALKAEGTQVGFSLSSTMDLYQKSLKTKKPSPTPMVASVLSGNAEIVLGDFILDYAESEDEFPDDPEQALTINGYGVSVVLNEQNSGPAHRFILTDANQTFERAGATSKLVALYDYFVYNEDGFDQFRISYRLTDYTTYRSN